MRSRIGLMGVLIGGLVFSAGWGLAEETQQTEKQAQEQEKIYGSELMTPEERAEYREKIRAARTAEERENIRMEHHIHMKERAKELGKTLPDLPPERGRGGMAPGSGLGPGKGMGPEGGSKR